MLFDAGMQESPRTLYSSFPQVQYSASQQLLLNSLIGNPDWDMISSIFNDWNQVISTTVTDWKTLIENTMNDWQTLFYNTIANWKTQIDNTVTVWKAVVSNTFTYVKGFPGTGWGTLHQMIQGVDTKGMNIIPTFSSVQYFDNNTRTNEVVLKMQIPKYIITFIDMLIENAGNWRSPSGLNMDKLNRKWEEQNVMNS